MKILFLNAWDARVPTPLSNFIKDHIADTDVFCFQEANDSMLELCRDLLRDYSVVTARKFVSVADDFRQATYVKNTINITSSSAILDNGEKTGLGVYTQLEIDGASVHICNFHGVSRPTNKHDTPERLQQSQKLIEFCAAKTGAVIIGGDFNIFPQNESQQLFQKSGYRDLIHDYNITNTRNRYVWDRYPENPKQYYSDYVFVNSNVHINSFIVPDVEVSDHEPLILDVSTHRPSPAR